MSNYFVENNLSGLKREDFQSTVQGKQTDLFILQNSRGHEVAITNYGGILLTIMMPDKNGKMESVILGHDNIQSVINSPEAFLGALIGRWGNRIAKATFTLDGKEYKVALNDGPNHLHGGPTGYHKRVWDAEQVDQQTLNLHYLSVDGEEGYPGNLDINVMYKLTDLDELVIEYRATTDKKTVLNLTNHAFFNLNGMRKDSKSVYDFQLTVNADHYLPIDETSIPYGNIDKVEGTVFDFRQPHAIGERIDTDCEQIRHGSGYDHCYVLNKREPGELSFAIRCVDPESGRSMECFTTEPAIQVYTGNFCNGCECAHGATLPRRSAVCFETQHFPDSPNEPFFPTTVLNPGEEYSHTAIYRFGVE